MPNARALTQLPDRRDHFVDGVVDWAKRVVDAFARSHGNAALLDGKMIDRPVLERAEAMLAEARQSVRD